MADYTIKNVWDSTKNVLLMDCNYPAATHRNLKLQSSRGIWSIQVVQDKYLVLDYPLLNDPLLDEHPIYSLKNSISNFFLLDMKLYGCYSYTWTSFNTRRTLYCLGRELRVVDYKSPIGTMDLAKNVILSKKILKEH